MGGKKLVILGAGLLLLFFLASAGQGLEKVKLGTGHKSLEVFYLLVMTAEEKGLWSRQGLEVEWVPFAATGPLMKAMAAGHIKVGLSTALGIVPAQARGLPALMVAEYQKGLPFRFHVLTKSPVREIKDLKGLKVAISSRGGSTEMIARIMARAAGVEDFKFVAVGGLAQASEFVATNPTWSVEKVKSEKGYSQKTAEYAYKIYNFTGEVAIAGERVERLRTALIEFGLFQEKEMPRTPELFTNRFVP